MDIRPAAVAGTWYPGTAGALAREVDGYVRDVPDGPPGLIRAVHQGGLPPDAWQLGGRVHRFGADVFGD